MERNTPNQSSPVPHSSEAFGSVPNGSEGFRKVPNASEPFRTVPNDAESFRTLPNHSERKENHTLTVREAARMFEMAGVARTERSIVNWSQPNRTGVARLDAYYDPNERRYFISPQSVELAIAEEKAKAAKLNDPAEAFGKIPQNTEAFRTVPNDAEPAKKTTPASEGGEPQIWELKLENQDLKITNRAKDIVIQQMQKEREVVFDQLLKANRKMGELENRLLQLGTSDEKPNA